MLTVVRTVKNVCRSVSCAQTEHITLQTLGFKYEYAAQLNLLGTTRVLIDVRVNVVCLCLCVSARACVV